MKTEYLYDIKRLVHTWPFSGRQGSGNDLDLRDLTISTGECLALTGPNGSGKTTVLKLLNGLLPTGPQSWCHFAGQPLANSPELRRRSIYLHQHPYLLSGSVHYNIAWPCRERGLGRQETERRVGSALERVGLSGFGPRDRRALSGGEIQRVALARALACGADIFLLDEPTASIDAASFAAITGLLQDLKASACTLILASHDPNFTANLADRTVELRAGRIVAMHPSSAQPSRHSGDYP